MHEYPLRISEVLWKRIEIEAEARGLLISDMLREIIEKGLLKIYEEEAKYGKIKFEQTDSEWHS